MRAGSDSHDMGVGCEGVVLLSAMPAEERKLTFGEGWTTELHQGVLLVSSLTGAGNSQLSTIDVYTLSSREEGACPE